MKVLRLTAIVLAFAFSVDAEEAVTGTLKEAKQDADKASALDTVAYINQMNYAYTVMKTYHNVLAVQDEYDKISIDRIDVTRIPSFSYDSKAMLTLIEDMLDALKALKMNEEDYKYYQEKLEDSRRRAKKEMWLNIVAAIPKTVKNVGDVVKSGLSQGGNPYVVAGEAVLTLAGDIVGEPMNAVLNYDKTVDELRAATKESRFKYDRTKEEEVHKTNKKLIAAEFAFIKDKNLSSEDIVTPDELQSLVNALKNGKSERVFRLLNTTDMNNRFRRFAPYWYYLASFAVKCQDWDVAIKASDAFFAEYRGLVKVDPMVAQVAIANVTAIISKGRSGHLDKISDSDRKKIDELIKKICDVNYNNTNPDYSYFCADVAYRILNEPKRALAILGASNAYIEGTFESKLVMYRNKYTEGEIALDEKDLPKDIDLIRIRTLYNDILLERKSGDLVKNAIEICRNQTTSSLEKLFYIGRVRVDDLWNEAKQDVLAIKTRYIRPWGRNYFSVELPVSWLLLGEVKSKLVMCKGDDEVATVEEDQKARMIRKNDAGIGTDIVTMKFPFPGKELRGIDSVRLVFEHKAWPIEITYKPSLEFDISTGKDKKNETEYTQVKIKFMGVDKDLLAPPENVKDAILDDKLKRHSCFFMPFQFGSTAYSTNFLTAISISNDRTFEVAYTNPTPSNTSIDLVVNYYSRYGAKLCEVESSHKLKAGTGGTWKLPWPSDMLGTELPAYVLFQYHVDNEVWERWMSKQVSSRGAASIE